MAILIVDDSEDIRLLLRPLLQKEGYTDLYTAESSKEAFQLLGMDEEESAATERPSIDLILMDVAMPDIDGIEACRKIKAIEHLHDIPIIMVTSIDETKLLEIALDAGAIDYITKPINKVELLARVRSSLRLKEEIDHRKQHEEELATMANALKVANERLKELSFIDGLTGIANRRYFDEYLDEELRRAKRDQTFISLIMIDIDYFKKFNDSMGHLKGDECLHKVANTLKESLQRPADMAARYGGEEFAIVLPETDKTGAMFVAERLRSQIEALEIKHPNSTAGKYLTISLGVTTMDPDMDQTVEELIKSADKALYEAKEEGRNRVKAADRAKA